MKILYLTTFFLCCLQVSGFFLNHTCYTIKDKIGYKAIKTCVECFSKAYSKNEPTTVDVLNEAAKECVKQLPANFTKCLSQTKDQKDCLEDVARKHFRSMSSFWHPYRNTLTKEEKCQFHQYLGIVWYTYTIKKHSEADWQKLHDLMEPCRKLFHDNVKFGIRSITITKVSEKEAKDKEEQMEEADRLRHKIGLTGKYLYVQCILTEVKKDCDARKIFVDAIETHCHNVPLMVVNLFTILNKRYKCK